VERFTKKFGAQTVEGRKKAATAKTPHSQGHEDSYKDSLVN
jgi:hypothetical protein